MSGELTVKYLQEYIKSKDCHPELIKDYYIKLTEEVGELSRAIRKDLRPSGSGQIKDTIDEELWDIMYYALAIANCYGIDLEAAIRKKEEINNLRYNTGTTLNPDKN